jgi:4a-hydroxytetrahydrobiopterin dehydratase
VRLSDDDVRARAPEGWTLTGDSLTREFTFTGFTAAVAFVDRLVAPANEARHHPDLEIHYDRVGVTLSTHDEGGVTEKDISMAETIDRLIEG